MMRLVPWLGVVSLVAVLTFHCGTDQSLYQTAARRLYNEGFRTLHEGDWETAESAFLTARNEAGTDSELRYRSAFNLGVAYAQHADEISEEDLEQAIGLLRQSAAWFNDVVRSGLSASV